MSKETKLVQFIIADGNEEQVKALTRALSNIKSKLPFDVEFLVTNDKVKMRDVKYLITELYQLYKKENRGKNGKKD